LDFGNKFIPAKRRLKMSVSVEYGTNICIEGENGKIYAWGTIKNGEYGI
jgi:hypothetical protein